MTLDAKPAFRRTGFLGIAFGFVIGTAQAVMDTSQAIGSSGLSRILTVAVIIAGLVALTSWLARIAIVGRLTKDADPSFPNAVIAAVYFAIATNLGLLFVFVAVFAGLSASWLLGWEIGRFIRAMIGLVLLVALFGMVRNFMVNLALIATRNGKAGI